MGKIMKHSGQWKSGQSGNPTGRPKQKRVLAEVLRMKGEELITFGGEEMRVMDVVAGAVWQFAATGEVMLAGKHLVAESVTEWASVVKWLYLHLDSTRQAEAEAEPELVVRVVRVDKGEKI